MKNTQTTQPQQSAASVIPDKKADFEALWNEVLKPALGKHVDGLHWADIVRRDSIMRACFTAYCAGKAARK